MRITAEVSFYPMQDNFLPGIVEFIHSIQDAPGLEVAVNQMSTQLTGELRDVSQEMRSHIRHMELIDVPK